MDSFETYFRKELAYLRLLGRDMAQQYPHLQDFLGEPAADPDVERLLEGFSVLSASLQEKINDAFPEVTHPLLSLTWSQLLRLHPATTIVAFRGATPDVNRILPAGTMLLSKPEGEQPACRFSTCRDLQLLPLELVEKTLTHQTDGSQLALTFRWYGQPGTLPSLATIPVYLGADQASAGLLTLWFEQYLTRATLSQAESSHPLELAHLLAETVVPVLPPLSDERPFRHHLQQLQEYLYSPGIGQFITFCLARALPQGVQLLPEFTLRFYFDRLLPPVARRLPADLQLNCVPAINLFSEQSKVLHPEAGAADCFPEPATEGAAISAVLGVDTWQEPGRVCGQPLVFWNVTRFVRQLGRTSGIKQLFYQATRQRDGLGRIRHQLRFIDSEGEAIQGALPSALVCQLLCTDGERGDQLPVGALCVPAEEAPGDVFFSNITATAPAWPAMEEGAQHWLLLSHLTLSPLSLNQVEAIRQLISDFDFRSQRDVPHQQRLQQRLRGLVGLSSQPIDWLFNGVPQRGMRCEIRLDATNFEDEGECYRFGMMLSRFLAATLTVRSFLMIELINIDNGEHWSVPMTSGYHPIQ